MKKKMKHNRIDEVLRILLLKKSKSLFNSNIQDVESDIVFSAAPSISMGIPARDRLVEKLFDTIESNSLGELISKTSAENGIEDKELSAISGLTVGVIEEIKHDDIFPNSIPIHGLKKLLLKLQIGFGQSEKAIRKTFETLMIEVNNSKLQLSGVQPSFRKQNQERSFKYGGGQPSSRANGLFRNDKALNKYLTRLGELYNE